jgi:hypothetical protein
MNTASVAAIAAGLLEAIPHTGCAMTLVARRPAQRPPPDDKFNTIGCENASHNEHGHLSSGGHLENRSLNKLLHWKWS